MPQSISLSANCLLISRNNSKTFTSSPHFRFFTVFNKRSDRCPWYAAFPVINKTLVKINMLVGFFRWAINYIFQILNQFWYIFSHTRRRRKHCDAIWNTQWNTVNSFSFYLNKDKLNIATCILKYQFLQMSFWKIHLFEKWPSGKIPAIHTAKHNEHSHPPTYTYW